jgi:hypothetical protein
MAMGNEELLLVFTNAAEGREEEFHRWYDEVHIPDVLRVPGVESAQRHVISPVVTEEIEGAPNPAPPAHQFMVAYTLSRSGNEVMSEFTPRVTSGDMPLSDVMDFETIALSVWKPMGSRVVATD